MGKAKSRRALRRLGHPHRHYRKPWTLSKIDPILKTLIAPDAPSVRSLSRETAIPLETLRRWSLKLKEDPDWTPKETRWGEHRRIFSDDEETAISLEIRENYLTTHQLFTSEDFTTLIVERYLLKFQNSESIPDFVCSSTFVRDFMTRNRFSLRRQHFRRRPGASADQANAWTTWLSSLLRTHDPDLILNCDETSWRLYPNNILTWWDTGADDVSVQIHGDEKETLTVLATISASGVKWPLYFLAKGKTQRVENSQIGDVGDHWRSHSISGWMTSDTFSDYLQLLRLHAPSENVIHLVLDLHSSHRTEAVKSLASSLNIELHYVPAGMTDVLQPLDRTVFGALKAHARRLFRLRARDNPLLQRTKQDAAQDMISAWDLLSPGALFSGWEIYEGEPWEDDSQPL